MVLIIDDEAALGASLEKLFRYHGMAAICVPNGIEALIFLHTNMPSLIILDLNMPGLNGLELLDELRTDAQLRQVPIMIYTADFSRDSEEAAIDGGAQAYIIKGTMGIEAVVARARELIRDRREPPVTTAGG